MRLLASLPPRNSDTRPLTGKVRVLLSLFGLTFVVMIAGVVMLDWWFVEMTTLFFVAVLLAGLVLGEFRRMQEDDTPALTERETEVLKMVAKGMSYKQIAERLVLSHRTVQNHVQNTLRKLQMHNRVELTRYAIAQGLDDDED